MTSLDQFRLQLLDVSFLHEPRLLLSLGCNGGLAPAHLGVAAVLSVGSGSCRKRPGRGLEDCAHSQYLALWLAAASSLQGVGLVLPLCWGLPCPAQIGLRPRIMLTPLHSAQATRMRKEPHVPAFGVEGIHPTGGAQHIELHNCCQHVLPLLQLR